MSILCWFSLYVCVHWDQQNYIKHWAYKMEFFWRDLQWSAWIYTQWIYTCVLIKNMLREFRIRKRSKKPSLGWTPLGVGIKMVFQCSHTVICNIRHQMSVMPQLRNITTSSKEQNIKLKPFIPSLRRIWFCRLKSLQILKPLINTNNLQCN